METRWLPIYHDTMEVLTPVLYGGVYSSFYKNSIILNCPSNTVILEFETGEGKKLAGTDCNSQLQLDPVWESHIVCIPRFFPTYLDRSMSIM